MIMNHYYCSKCGKDYYSASDYSSLNNPICECGGIIFYHHDSLPKIEQLKKDVSKLEGLVEEVYKNGD